MDWAALAAAAVQLVGNYLQDQSRQDAISAQRQSEQEAQSMMNERAYEQFPQIDPAFIQQMMQLFQPYIQTGRRVLPRMEQAYYQGLNLAQNQALPQVTSPQFLAKLNQSKPAYEVNVPLPGPR